MDHRVPYSNASFLTYADNGARKPTAPVIFTLTFGFRMLIAYTARLATFEVRTSFQSENMAHSRLRPGVLDISNQSLVAGYTRRG